MNFAFSEEQDEFRAILRRFVEERWSLADVRRLLDTPEGYDRSVWKQMAEELGLQGLVVPERHGGQGFGFLELGIALEELGRQLAGGPFLATVCATLAVANAGSDADHARWLPAVAAGDVVAGLAHAEDADGSVPDAITCRAEADGDGFRLSGRKPLVLDAPLLDLLVVSARLDDGDGIGLFVVSTGDEGVHVQPVDALDLTRRLGDVELRRAPAQRLGHGDVEPALARTLDQAAVALCAEMVGAAAGCLDMAVAYAKTRVQFARPIGSFQAIQHKAAEVLLELECARSAAYWAWWVAAQEEGELTEASSLAKSLCAEAFDRAARENLQIHGGLGATWEHDGHLFSRRARADEVLFGSAAAHRARLARQLGL